MKCVILGRCIRAFGKAIQCLSKIGDELYLEALSEGLGMKTVNPARSAYASFLFKRRFFHTYEDGRISPDAETLKCKITIKSCTSVFRSLHTLEKTVDHCTLRLDLGNNKLMFVFHCKHGIVKTHNLGFQECEALQAVYSKDLCPNKIACDSKVLADVVSNFPSNLEEVSLTAEPDKIKLRSYTEDDGENTRVAISEISLVAAEFNDYKIGIDATITFCLKELRAVLLFTEAINHTLSLKFETGGKPVVISIDDCTEYQADFVLATLLDLQDTTSSQVHDYDHQAQNSQQELTSNHHSKEQSFIDDREELDPHHRGGTKSRELLKGSNTVPSPPQAFHLNILQDYDTTEGVPQTTCSREPEEMDVERGSLTDALFETNSEGATSSRTVRVAQQQASDKEDSRGDLANLGGRNWTVGAQPSWGEGLGRNWTLEMQPSREEDAQLEQYNEPDEEPEDNLCQSGVIPGTPPAKKLKASIFDMDIFLQNHNTSEVLAPDSDDDDD